MLVKFGNDTISRLYTKSETPNDLTSSVAVLATPRSFIDQAKSPASSQQKSSTSPAVV